MLQVYAAPLSSASIPPLHTAPLYRDDMPRLCGATLYHNSIPQLYTTTLHHNSTPQLYTTTLYHNSVPQLYTTTLHHNSIPQLYTGTLKRASTPRLCSATLYPRFSGAKNYGAEVEVGTTVVGPPRRNGTTHHHIAPSVRGCRCRWQGDGGWYASAPPMAHPCAPPLCIRVPRLSGPSSRVVGTSEATTKRPRHSPPPPLRRIACLHRPPAPRTSAPAVRRGCRLCPTSARPRDSRGPCH